MRQSRFFIGGIMTSEIITQDRIVFLNETNKDGALCALIKNLSEAPQVKDTEELRAEILKREALLSTAIGCGIAIPHVRLASVTDLVVTVGISKVDIAGFTPLDNIPVSIILMIAAAENQHTYYLQTISYFCSLLKDEALRTALRGAKDSKDAYDILLGKH
jgi:PTS system nitrogen regulatory IIA component